MMKYIPLYIIIVISSLFIRNTNGTLDARYILPVNETGEMSALRKLVLHMALNMEEMDLEVKKLRNSCAMKTELEDLASKINETESQGRSSHSDIQSTPIVNPQYQTNGFNIETKHPSVPSLNMSSMEQMIKLLVRGSCYEWKQAGFVESGIYEIDPDGQGIGDPPFSVYCDMVTGFTFVRHNMEAQQEAGKCEGPGCSVGRLSYAATAEQIKALIYTSHSCQQFIKINCKQSPLTEDGIPLAWWKGEDGEKHYEWAGDSYPSHTCACGYTFACVYPQESCNCDANIPNVWVSDSGYVTNTSALPIQEVAFGSSYGDTPAQITYSVGPLRCHGAKDIAYPRSCLELFTKGTQQSGWYLIGEPTSVVLSFCDMDYPDQEPVQYNPSSDDVIEHGTPVHINFVDLLTHHLQIKGLAIGTLEDLLQLKESQKSLETQLSLVSNEIRNLTENLSNQQSSVISEQETYTEKLSEMDEKIKKIQETARAQNTDIEALQTNVTFLSDVGVGENKKIIFHAKKKSGTQTASATIVFETVDLNVGNGYDSNTGKFKAPVSGIYLIAAYTRSSTSSMYFHMYKDSSYVALSRVRSSSSTDHSTGVSVILRLSVGNEVYIKISSGGIKGASDGGTSFMGYLISE